jgi:phenylalanyl-tRNA synthetase beta chain
VLEVVERNARVRERIALFEIGPVYLASEGSILPEEPLYLAIALTGPRELPAWQGADTTPMDFFDLKGILSSLFVGLHLDEVTWVPAERPTFHPGKCSRMLLGERQIGVMGELHPQVAAHYKLPVTPLLAAEVNIQAILDAIPERFQVRPVSPYPPVLEDLAVVVDESIPASQVASAMQAAGGKTVTELRLFDVYRGEKIGAGKKSLAYSLTYQDPERTLTDEEVSRVRQRIIRRIEQELGARLRS